ncbi:MAG: thiamine-phosphate kinase, partial [Bacteroidales bacterium]|nr:thiamine-phosphate kinase [Bacteroidales bacterium]
DVVPTSMMDISDGLSSELLHICKQSKCGCQIYQDRIPIAEETARAASEFEMDPLIAALNGGEDYELLFTVPLSAHEKVKTIPGIHIIGNITDLKDHAVLVTQQGEVIRLEAQGWNAYRNR